MTADRIKEIQSKTAFPDSVSVCQALFQVWNECKEESYHKKYTKEDMLNASKYGYEFRDTTSFPEHKFEDSCINNTKAWIHSLNKQD